MELTKESVYRVSKPSCRIFAFFSKPNLNNLQLLQRLPASLLEPGLSITDKPVHTHNEQADKT